MTSVQIPFIEFTNNRIQKSSIIIDNNQFNVEFKDNKYIVTKGNVMSQSNSPAAPIVTESAEPIVTESAAPTVAKNSNEKPEEIESTNIAAETNKKGADPKPLKRSSNTKNEPIKKELTDKEKMMQDLFKAIALRRKTVDERDKIEKVQEEGEKGTKVEKVQKDKEEEAKPTESKYEKYNQMKKVGLPEGAIKLEMSKDGIEEKKINDYFDSQEYKDIKPSTN
jgi:hypothetical protein